MASLVKGKQVATGTDGVDTANLVDDAVTNAKIGALAVDTTEIAADAVTNPKIAALAVDTAEIAANAVTSAKVDSSVLIAAGTNALTGNLAAGGFKITGLADGTLSTDSATKGQVDAAQAGLDVKASCRVGTVAALPAVTASGAGAGKTLTADAVGVLTVDGTATVLTDRILVQNQVTTSDNGIYEVTTEGTVGVAFVLTRATDADTDAKVTAGMFTFLEEGSTLDNKGFVLITNDPIVVDTTGLLFSQFSGLGQITAGTGLIKVGDTINAVGGLGITANADDLEVDFAVVGSITTIDAGDIPVAGTSDTAARGDHEHGVTTGSAVSLAAANAEGSGPSLARANHTHARDVENQEEVTTEAITGTDTTMADTLNATPTLSAAVRLWLNGLLQVQGAGKDYTVSGTAILWLASSGSAVDMEISDQLVAAYISQG